MPSFGDLKEDAQLIECHCQLIDYTYRNNTGNR